ncbi:hypothetical protein [uncultured Stenotrophomonas sp.]|uniref:hypothetical protein n=1 Tax=uncultured Stenotrophomonas sp. TaxID=165438 RepID=UPI0028D2EC1C|nr:hypothetical protein [uncultured Stenotrophomonas sp.]
MFFDTKYSYSNLSAGQRERLRSLVLAVAPAPQGSGLPLTGAHASARQPKSSKFSASARQQAGVLKYFKERDFEGVAVTLTFKSSRFPEYLSEGVAEAAVRELIKRLNKFCNGKKRPALQVIAVREGSAGPKAAVRLHYHLKIEVPAGVSNENFAQKVEHYWSQLRWAGREMKVVPKCDHGWLSYILKTNSKPDYADAIDWLNTQVPPRPVAERTVGG